MNNNNSNVENKIERTQGEWKIKGTTKSIKGIYIGTNKDNICQVYTSIRQSEANAAFICEAVNNYSKLKEEKELAIKEIEWLAKHDQHLKEVNDKLLSALKNINGLCADYSCVENGRINVGKITSISIEAIKAAEQ